jgi:anion-transporting  ArsA/GET3 family ATPase
VSALIVTGGGGVGKTTLSGALALGSARRGLRTCVVTVDPARRLADAFGVETLGNRPTPVPGQDDLWAAMLDVTASWEAIVHRHADPAVAERLLVNPFFRAIADRFPAAQAYAAGEQMAEHIESRRWDLLVVDTPPAGGGIDFYTAPRRMQEMIGGRLLRWLTGASIPGRRALYRITARPALRLADTVLGGPLLEEIAEFLLDLRSLHDGLVHRAAAIERHLQAARTVVVTTTDAAPLREARRFFDEVGAERGRPGAVIFNKQLPTGWAHHKQLRTRKVNENAKSVLRDNLANWAGEVRRQEDIKTGFAARYGVAPLDVPWVTVPPTSVPTLGELLDGSPDLEQCIDQATIT